MRLRTWFGLVAVALVGAEFAGTPVEAMNQPSCSLRARQCELICAARPQVRPYTSRYDRCYESCEPRWQQCLRTGIWVHLEDAYPGWREQVDIF